MKKILVAGTLILLNVFGFVACSSNPDCKVGGFVPNETVTAVITLPSGASCPSTGAIPPPSGSGCLVTVTANAQGEITIPNCQDIVKYL
jgi:hypothetical protein